MTVEVIEIGHDMPTPLLLVSTTTNWLGTARIPRNLARAGFAVDLLTPRNALADASPHVRAFHYLPERASPAEFGRALARAFDASQPRLLVPCDDMAFRLLAETALRPSSPAGPAGTTALRAAIVESLGDPAFYRASVDKTALPALAMQLGVDVPPHAIVDSLDAARRFVAANGFPVVVKRAHGFAGQGVAICSSLAEVAAALAAFGAADREDPLLPHGSPKLIQSWIDGHVEYLHAAAWRGTLRACFALEKIVAHPHPVGPPTVTRWFHAPALEAIARRLIAGCGISGLLFAEFAVDRDGRPWLLEINRRVSPATHRGEARNVDFCAALFAALHDTKPSSRARLDDGEAGFSVHFPQEWLRDPRSRWLLDVPADAPWDEPALLAAMLRMRDG